MAAKTKTKVDMETGDQPRAVVIKKYANRRLYNTASSSYVTLDDLSQMVKDGTDFVVYDAKSGDEITRSVLTQIIFEQESRGQSLLPVAFLRRLIGYYGDSFQSFVPTYLDMSMETFSKKQETWRERFSGNWVGAIGIDAFEEQARQNMALFEQAMRMWTPFAGTAGMPGAAAPNPKPAEPASEQSLDDMRRQLDEMQRRLDAIARPQTEPTQT